jgi:hypothetical protein
VSKNTTTDIKKAERQKRRNSRKKTQKEKDEIFHGWDEMTKLAKGIYEEDEPEAESEYPESWAKIAAEDEETQKKISERLIAEAKKKSKGRMKHCNPEGGNPHHSKETGRFTTADSDGSWSIRTNKTSPDCTAGVWRKAGGAKRVFVKQPCGRESDKNLCGTKDGVRAGRGKANEDLAFAESLMNAKREDAEFFSKLVSFFKGLAQKLQTEGAEDKKAEKEMAYCKKRYGLKTFNDFLTVVDKIERSQKGDLFKPQK